jgi:hypothetical protein
MDIDVEDASKGLTGNDPEQDGPVANEAVETVDTIRSSDDDADSSENVDVFTHSESVPVVDLPSDAFPSTDENDSEVSMDDTLTMEGILEDENETVRVESLPTSSYVGDGNTESMAKDSEVDPTVALNVDDSAATVAAIG